MRFLITILLTFTLFGCIEKNEYQFTESEAYTLINKHISDHLKPNDSNIIYWNVRMIKQSTIDTSLPDSSNQLQLKLQLTPSFSFSDKYWDTSKIKGVKPVSWEAYNYFFTANDSPDIKSKWYSIFGDNRIHCVSFPEFYPEKGIVVIRHVLSKPNVYCGTGTFHEFHYKKTNSEWKEVKY